MTQGTSLATLRQQGASSAPPEMRAGFETIGGFELMQRGARLLSSSTIVPAQYRAEVEKKVDGKIKLIANPAGMSNCVVALNMAQRLGADPLMIMQNLYIVEGRPSWSSQYIIASINACGKFSPLRFTIEDLGEKDAEYTHVKWEGQYPNRHRTETQMKTTIQDKRCIAWAIEKETGERLESPPVTIELAVKEGWFGKEGSKWQTMPEVMLRYRAASFFGKLYSPELLMGLQTAEEVHDSTYDMEKADNGAYTVTLADMKKADSTAEDTPPPAQPTPEAEPATPTKNAKAEMDALRISTRELWESTGRTLEEAEKVTGLYLKQWNRATCTKVEEEARRLLAAKPAPAAHPAPSDASTIQCPKVDALIDDMECIQCREREGCPAWE